MDRETYQQGDCVIVILDNGGMVTGRVAYQRMAPPNYDRPVAVSVVLDHKRNVAGYKGTIFAASQVEHAPPEPRSTT